MPDRPILPMTSVDTIHEEEPSNEEQYSSSSSSSSSSSPPTTTSLSSQVAAISIANPPPSAAAMARAPGPYQLSPSSALSSEIPAVPLGVNTSVAAPVVQSSSLSSSGGVSPLSSRKPSFNTIESSTAGPISPHSTSAAPSPISRTSSASSTSSIGSATSASVTITGHGSNNLSSNHHTPPLSPSSNSSSYSRLSKLIHRGSNHGQSLSGTNGAAESHHNSSRKLSAPAAPQAATLAASQQQSQQNHFPGTRPHSSSSAAATADSAAAIAANVNNNANATTATNATSPPSAHGTKHSSLFRRNTTATSTGRPNSAGAGAGAAAVVSASSSAATQRKPKASGPTATPANNIAMSFGAETGVATAAELNRANTMQSYAANQRPQPVPSSRSFSVSRLTSRFTKHRSGSDSSDSNVPTPAGSTPPSRQNSRQPSRQSSFSSVSSSRPPSPGHEKENPADYLPSHLLVKDWHLGHKYSFGKLKKKTLGDGATATVIVVTGPSLIPGSKEKETYACKVYKKRPPKSAETVREYYETFADEYVIMRNLQHMNVVHAFDLMVDSKGAWCTILEYCENGDLHSLLELTRKYKKRMSREQRACLFKQLLYGINYIHSRGIAHRDIKPENLLISARGELKISDFGVSVYLYDGNPAPEDEAVADATVKLASGLCGSEFYMAPEIHSRRKLKEEGKGDGHYDARKVDIWACAVTFFNIFYGFNLWGVADFHKDNLFKKFSREIYNYWIQELDSAYMNVISILPIYNGYKGMDESTTEEILAIDAAANEQLQGPQKSGLANILRLEELVDNLRDVIEEIDEWDVEVEEHDRLKKDKERKEKFTAEGQADKFEPTPAPAPPKVEAVDAFIAEHKRRPRVPRYDLSFYHSQTNEEQPLFMVNSAGEGIKRMLAQMLLPFPEKRPSARAILAMPCMRKIMTCVDPEPQDALLSCPLEDGNSEDGGIYAGATVVSAGPSSTSGMLSAAQEMAARDNGANRKATMQRTQTAEDMKKLLDASRNVRRGNNRHNHDLPVKPPSGHGLGEFKQAPHEFY
ncbi:uncharacterized protein SAPINGB_P004120 [Magnusiomyces paraingens]|uniref:non-specific serine/threonine protein kinase n=1 Tax=Magnusiomyces paraingens TaxID=2606893 RepID=A0A5E8BY99_9ASCO|nr:uncharacterized protein SAPINGB_P004120 [Saprochaete ingens]VVT54527.1 unnamed protein product [Saprochaete ingens]